MLDQSSLMFFPPLVWGSAWVRFLEIFFGASGGPDRAITAEKISELFEYFRDFIGHRDMCRFENMAGMAGMGWITEVIGDIYTIYIYMYCIYIYIIYIYYIYIYITLYTLYIYECACIKEWGWWPPVNELTFYEVERSTMLLMGKSW